MILKKKAAAYVQDEEQSDPCIMHARLKMTEMKTPVMPKTVFQIEGEGEEEMADMPRK